MPGERAIAMHPTNPDSHQTLAFNGGCFLPSIFFFCQKWTDKTGHLTNFRPYGGVEEINTRRECHFKLDFCRLGAGRSELNWKMSDSKRHAHTAWRGGREDFTLS